MKAVCFLSPASLPERKIYPAIELGCFSRTPITYRIILVFFKAQKFLERGARGRKLSRHASEKGTLAALLRKIEPARVHKEYTSRFNFSGALLPHLFESPAGEGRVFFVSGFGAFGFASRAVLKYTVLYASEKSAAFTDGPTVFSLWGNFEQAVKETTKLALEQNPQARSVFLIEGNNEDSRELVGMLRKRF